MSNRERKHGFAPTQQGAADFTLAAARFDAAHRAAQATGKTEAETERLADIEHEAADHLLGIPAPDVPAVVQKLDAYSVAFGSGYRLTDPDVQRRIADGRQDDAKGLLAISLDLQAIAQAPAQPTAPSVSREAWNAALAKYQTANAAYEADNTDDPEDLLWAARDNAAETLLATPAPDAAALAVKAIVGIDRAHVEKVGERGVDAATLARILSEGAWDSGRIVVRLLQDTLRLAGGSPLCDVEAFSAECWLTRFTEAGGGAYPLPGGGANFGVPLRASDEAKAAEMLWREMAHWPAYRVEAVKREVHEAARQRARDMAEDWVSRFEAAGGTFIIDADATEAAFGILTPEAASMVEALEDGIGYRREAVLNEAARQENTRRWIATNPPKPFRETPPEELRQLFTHGLLNTFDGDDREAMRASLAALGLTPRALTDATEG